MLNTPHFVLLQTISARIHSIYQATWKSLCLVLHDGNLETLSSLPLQFPSSQDPLSRFKRPQVQADTEFFWRDRMGCEHHTWRSLWGCFRVARFGGCAVCAWHPATAFLLFTVVQPLGANQIPWLGREPLPPNMGHIVPESLFIETILHYCHSSEWPFLVMHS